jgi:hypothetical protein
MNLAMRLITAGGRSLWSDLEETADRRPYHLQPHVIKDRRTEELLLGCILSYKDARKEVVDHSSPSMFVWNTHLIMAQKIWKMVRQEDWEPVINLDMVLAARLIDTFGSAVEAIEDELWSEWTTHGSGMCPAVYPPQVAFELTLRLQRMEKAREYLLSFNQLMADLNVPDVKPLAAIRGVPV